MTTAKKTSKDPLVVDEAELQHRDQQTKDTADGATEEDEKDEDTKEDHSEDDGEGSANGLPHGQTEAPDTFDINNVPLDLPEEGSEEDDGTLGLPHPYDYHKSRSKSPGVPD